ncbi:hypothetical protein RhiirB3_434064 [Rhizophagus irregularis]|nr:hypothetical protein RhiirB3_434064 [Rhizophagus irregularis]
MVGKKVLISTILIFLCCKYCKIKNLKNLENTSEETLSFDNTFMLNDLNVLKSNIIKNGRVEYDVDFNS